jgi:hypothetical protein
MRYFLIYIVFLCLTIFYFSVLKNSSQENFTPKLREFYRPYIRHTKGLYKNVYNASITKILNLLRRIGLIN